MTDQQQSLPIDESFYYRCMVPCAFPEREPILPRDQQRTLSAIVVSYRDGMPVRLETYIEAQTITNYWWGWSHFNRAAPCAIPRKRRSRRRKSASGK